MSGLADELLADLDGLSGDENEEDQQESPAPSSLTTAEASSSSGQKRKLEDLNSDEEMSGAEGEEEEGQEGGEVGSLVLEGGVKPADELDAEDVQQMELGSIDDISKIAKLEGSKRMVDILKVSPISLCLSMAIHSDLEHRQLKNIRKTLQRCHRWHSQRI